MEWMLKMAKYGWQSVLAVLLPLMKDGRQLWIRKAAWILTVCLVVTLMPFTAFAGVENIDEQELKFAWSFQEEMPGPTTVPSDKLYLRVTWKTEEICGPYANNANCEASYLHWYDFESADQYRYSHDGNFNRDGADFHFTRGCLNTIWGMGTMIEYTWDQRTPDYLFDFYIKSKLGITRSFGGYVIVELKDLTAKTNQWKTISAVRVKPVKGGTTWWGNDYRSEFVGFYDDVQYIPLNEPEMRYESHITHTPMIQNNLLQTSIEKVEPFDGISTYTLSGSPILMTTTGYTWISSDVVSPGRCIYPRMGQVTFKNPRIVGEDGTETVDIPGISVAENGDQSLKLNAGIVAPSFNEKKFRVAFDVCSEKYDTSTTAYTNVIEVQMPQADTPAAPTLIGNTAKTITINTVSDQKYMMTESSTAPVTSDTGWEEGTTGTKKYSNLTPGQTYYFWTYKPAGSGTTASKVSNALVVTTTAPISSVALTVPEPVPGEDVYDKGNFTVSDSLVSVSNVTWKTSSGYAAYVFGYEGIYYAEPTLKLSSATDNVFANNVSVTINGTAAAGVTRTDDKTLKVVSANFAQTPSKEGLDYTFNKDGTEWTTNAPKLRLMRNGGSYGFEQLATGDYEIYVQMPGGTYQPTGQTLTVVLGEKPKLTLDYWTVTFHDAEDKALTQGYNLVQTVLAGSSPVAPTGTTLMPPKTGQILTWITKDSDDNGNTEETPFVIGADTVYEATDLYARWVDPITSVAVTNITAPQGGAKPDTEASVPEEVHYEFSDLKWSPEVNGTFDYNTQYTATVSLLAKKGQGFSDSLTAAVNGETASVTKAEGALATITYKFAPTEADPAPVVAAAKDTVKNHTYTVAQATANTEDDVKKWLATEINNLLTDAGVTTRADDITISSNSFQAAVAGTDGSASGTNGSFKFTAKLTKGSASDTTEEIEGSITATTYVGQDTTAAPAFTTSGTSYTKTGSTDNSAVFTLTQAAESGTRYYVYTDQAGETAAQATAAAEGTKLTVSGDAIAGITARTDLYITAQESDKQESSPAHVVVYPAEIQQTAAPVFEAGQDIYAKITEEINTASFVMKENYPEGTAYQVYESVSSETVMDGVTASGTGTGLTLTGISGLTDSTTYYISATEPEKTESQRVSVTVTPYVAPSVTLGTDSTVRAEYKEDVATTDAIELKYNPGSNPDTEFTVDDFKMVKKYGGEEPSYLTIKSINVAQNTMTIASAGPQHKETGGYLYYKDKYVGEITSDRYYAYTSKNANLSDLTLSEGTLNPKFDSATTSFTATVPNSVDKITITPATQDENATVKINHVAVEKGKGSDVELKIGENLIEVDVTAQDNQTTRKYLLTVIRETPEGEAPAFAAQGGDTYTKTSANDQTASFTLAQEAEAGTTYKVYAQVTGGSPLNMTAAATGTTLTLKDISAVTEETSYYISAAAPDKAESGRTRVTVKPYLAPAAAPIFEAVKKMLGQDESSVVFTLTNDVEGRTYHIYKTATGETPMPENSTNPAYAFANGSLTFTYTTLPEAEVTYYVAAAEENKPESNRTAISVQPYVAPEVSTAPSFSVASYGKVSSDDGRAEFTLTSTPVGTTTFKVYDQKTEGNSVDVKVSVNNRTMTLTGDPIENLTEKTVWYVAATEKGKNESTRIAVTINPYVAPSAALGGEQTDKKVSVSFNYEDADSATGTDTIDVILNKGTDPAFEFAADNFKLSSSDTENIPIAGVSVTRVDEPENKLTVQVTKSVTAAEAWLWYGETSLGKIQIAKSVSVPDSYGVSLSTSPTGGLSDETEGYSEAPVLTVEVKNSGNQPTGALQIALSGDNADQFTLSKSTLNSLSVSGGGISGDKDSFTVTPQTGLTAGTYTARVTVSGNNEISAGIDVSFKVSAQSHSVTYTLTNLTHGDQPERVEDGSALSAILTAETGYKLPDAITVSMGGTNLAEGAYTYDSTTGEVGISSVTGDVIITAEGVDKSSDKQITGFTIPDQVKDSEIDQTAHTIKVTMPAGTDLSSLEPEITISDKATVDPESGAAQNFSSPVTYTVTAEDGSTQDYTVTVEAESQTANIISEVDVTGITAPVAGAAPDTSAEDGTHWSAGTITWDPNHTVFAYETQYTASVTITAADGYQFAEAGALTATVDGADAAVTRTSDTAITVSYEFPATGAEGDTVIAVTDITGVPELAEVGKALKLIGTVVPSNATNQKIQWEVTDGGDTGAEIDEENNLTARASGEITVTATIKDGTAAGEDYTQEFTIKVAGVASSSDAEYVAKASDAIQNGKYSVKQSTTDDDDNFLSELVNLVNNILEKLFGEGEMEPIETEDITITEVIPAVEGDEENQDGEDGEFTFRVEVHKGDESNTVEGLTGTIEATPYVDEEQQEKDQEAVDEAIAAIEDAMSDIRVSQKDAKTKDRLKDTLKARAKKKAGNASVDEVQIIGEINFAEEGTYENPNGTEGSFTFKVCVSKGSVQNIWTEELEGTITPTEYVRKKPEITTSSLPDGTIGEDYEVTLKAKSDTEVTWSVADGKLPEGISLEEDTISGIPTEAGNFSVVISADNGSEQGAAEKTYTITISTGTEGTEHTITATAGTGGTISPSGTVTVADGGDQTFTITAEKNYYLSDVLVDNVSVGRQASYTFSRVSSDHTIEAVFTRGSLGPGTGGSGSGGSGSGSGSSGSGLPTTQAAPPSTATNVTATADGGSMTTTQTTTTDSRGKKTTVTHAVQKDAAGNVTGSTTTVTTDRVTTATDQGKTTITVNPEASAINTAAGAAGATNQNPLEVLVTVPQTVIGEIQKPEVNAVNVNVVIPKAAADNQAVEVAGTVIGKDVVQAARDSGKILEVTLKDEAGNLEAVWSLDGQAMKNAAGEATDLSLGIHTAPVQSADPLAVTVKEPVAARGAENGLALKISSTGTLLAPAKLTVPATGQTGFTPGTTVALYRYDEATKALTTVPGVYTVDENGNVTVDIPAGTRTGANEIYVLLAGPAGPVQDAGGTYAIQKGDTLNKISRQYGCSVQELLALNPGLDIYNLQVGQLLNIPGKVS